MSSPIYSLPPDQFPNVFEYLSSEQISLSTSVCKSWRSNIESSAFDFLWKERYEEQGHIPGEATTLVRRHISEHIVQTFTPDLVDRVVQYFGTGEKEVAVSTIKGVVVLGPSTMLHLRVKKENIPERIQDRTIEEFYGQTPWGSLCHELFINARVTSPEGAKVIGSSFWDGHWSGSDLPRGLPEFIRQCELPLRFFYRPDGSLKRVGDKIRLIVAEKLIILTLATTPDNESTQFEVNVQKKVTYSIARRIVPQHRVDGSRAAAMISPPWVDWKKRIGDEFDRALTTVLPA